MPYLIDSDVLIDLMAGDALTDHFLAALTPEGLAISVVTWLETYYGVLRSSDREEALRRHAAVVWTLRVEDFTLQIADRCARIRYQLETEGHSTRSRALDLMIAATALQHGCTLVTRNVRDYQDIAGLKLLIPGQT